MKKAFKLAIVFLTMAIAIIIFSNINRVYAVDRPRGLATIYFDSNVERVTYLDPDDDITSEYQFVSSSKRNILSESGSILYFSRNYPENCFTQHGRYIYFTIVCDLKKGFVIDDIIINNSSDISLYEYDDRKIIFQFYSDYTDISYDDLSTIIIMGLPDLEFTITTKEAEVCKKCKGVGQNICGNICNDYYYDIDYSCIELTCSKCNTNWYIYESVANYFGENFIFDDTYYHYYCCLNSGASLEIALNYGYEPFVCLSSLSTMCQNCDGLGYIDDSNSIENKLKISFYDTRGLIPEGTSNEYTYTEFLNVYNFLKSNQSDYGFIGLYLNNEITTINVINFIDEYGWDYICDNGKNMFEEDSGIFIHDTLQLYCYYKYYYPEYIGTNIFNIFYRYDLKNTLLKDMYTVEPGKILCSELKDDYDNYHYLIEIYDCGITSSTESFSGKPLYIVKYYFGFIFLFDFYNNKTFYKKLGSFSDVYYIDGCSNAYKDFSQDEISISIGSGSNANIATYSDMITPSERKLFVFSFLHSRIISNLLNDESSKLTFLRYPKFNIEKDISAYKYFNNEYSLKKINFNYASSEFLMNEFEFIYFIKFSARKLYLLTSNNEYVLLSDVYETGQFINMYNYVHGIDSECYYKLEDSVYMLHNFSIVPDYVEDVEDDINKYTITFNIEGIITNEEGEFGSKIEFPVIPIKEGYTVVGWAVDEEIIDTATYTVPANDVTIVAKYRINKYTITFNIEGIITNEEGEFGSKIEFPVIPIKEGYTVVGWAVDEEIIDTATYTVPANDVTIVAKYDLLFYKIIFISNNKIILSIRLKPGDLIEYPDTPTKQNYEFVCWKTLDGKEFQELLMPNQDVELIAIWTNVPDDINIIIESADKGCSIFNINLFITLILISSTFIIYFKKKI